MTQRLAFSRNAFTACALLLGAALLAGCETASTGTPTAQAAPAEPPMTRARAAELCWMSTEKGAASANLDKRADMVDKCIEDKLKASPAPVPRS